MDRQDDFERGVANRRAVLGDEWVDQSLGGTTQFMIAWLTKVTGNPMAIAWYMLLACVVGLPAMAYLRETAPRFTARA